MSPTEDMGMQMKHRLPPVLVGIDHHPVPLAHGYQRELNLHYIGYTKGVAKAKAEYAGFVDIECEDWNDNPELGYNLIIRGTKPTEKVEEFVCPQCGKAGLPSIKPEYGCTDCANNDRKIDTENMSLTACSLGGETECNSAA